MPVLVWMDLLSQAPEVEFGGHRVLHRAHAGNYRLYWRHVELVHQEGGVEYRLLFILFITIILVIGS